MSEHDFLPYEKKIMIFTTGLPGPDWAGSRTEDQHQRQWGEPEQTGEDSRGEHPLNKTKRQLREDEAKEREGRTVEGPLNKTLVSAQ